MSNFADALDTPKKEDDYYGGGGQVELSLGGGATAVATPVSSHTPLDPETVAILQNGKTFLVQQKLQWVEALTQGCFEQPNIYTIADKDSGKNVLLIQEQSQTVNRCCCAPGHSFFAKFYLVEEDGKTKKSEQAVMTLEREGCDCFSPCPKPCLCCFACKEDCSDASKLYVGDLQGDPGVTKGQRETTMLLGGMNQPIGGGGFKPVMQIMDRDTRNPSSASQTFAALRGPCFFGGCSEFCCDSAFGISIARPDQSVEELHKLPFGDFATITKKKPTGFGPALRELFTDSDIYEVSFVSPDITPQQKANILASMIHLDYVFFERDNDMVYCEGSDLHIVLFNCFCYGCM